MSSDLLTKYQDLLIEAGALRAQLEEQKRLTADAEKISWERFERISFLEEEVEALLEERPQTTLPVVRKAEPGTGEG